MSAESQPPYLQLPDLVSKIDQPWRDGCQKLLTDHEDRFKQAPGSSHNHQVWPGGYWDHITEAMNLANVLYDRLDSLRPLPFSKSDALLVIYLHDLEKPWKADRTFESEEDKRLFRSKLLVDYGIVLKPDQYNALTYVHGELDDYRSDRRVINELGVFCHSCDYMSARLWFDHAKSTNDPWQGAGRVLDHDA